LIDLLSISTRLDFTAVREDTISILGNERIDPIDKILLAEKYDVPSWLAPAYRSLCKRSQPIEEHEAERIGLKKTVLLARAREALRECRSRPPTPQSPAPFHYMDHISPTPGQVYDNVVERIVNEVFFPTPGMDGKEAAT
jgi:hypothetical protein